MFDLGSNVRSFLVFEFRGRGIEIAQELLRGCSRSKELNLARLGG